LDHSDGSPVSAPNYNNTFTWSGLRGVAGFTGQPRVARLGQHPLSQPVPSVPLNLLNRRTVGRSPRRKKITTQVWEGCLGGTRASVDLEPTTDPKLPAPLAFFLGTCFLDTGCLSLSFRTEGSFICRRSLRFSNRMSNKCRHIGP
jgi:hypothetical protein